MEQQKKKKIYLMVLISALIAVFSIAAYTNVVSKLANKPTKTRLHRYNSGHIQFSTKLNNRFYYDNKQVYLYIDLKADRVEIEKSRTPMNIAIVIDRSGSMEDRNKLSYVKKSVEYIIDQLESDDYVSIVSYNDYVNVLKRSGRVLDKSELKKEVEQLYAGGYTNLSGGLFEGYDQVNESYRRGYVNRVLLLSDGLANRGITDRRQLAQQVRERNRKDGIVISTFGVGSDFNEDLMTDIAEYGKGNYYYIRDAEQIPDIFAQELKGVRTLVGQSTKVRVWFPENYLTLNRVYGYPYEINGNEVTVDFKDVFSDQTKTVLLKFDINSRIKKGLEIECELSYEDVINDFSRVRESQFCYLEPVVSRGEYEKGYDEGVQQNVAVFEANQMMEDALKQADLGNYDDARKQLQMGKDYLNEQMNSITASPEMKQQLDGMDKYEEKLKSAETKTEEEVKEMQKSGKYDNYNTRKKHK
jgi:Ca-activated chloride channel family protein